MKQFFYMTTLFLGMLTCPFAVNAQTFVKPLSSILSFGPEIYYVNREKEGGSKQKGTLYGARLEWNYIKRNRGYWGVDGLWATGCITGKKKIEENNTENSSSSIRLKSFLTDKNIEGRTGFTFQSTCRYSFTFIPYLGIGYFWEFNHYTLPKELAFHFDNRFLYIPVGFLSQISLSSQWSLGLNFKIRVLVDGWQTVSHDPKFKKHDINYKEKLQYRGELPISYYFVWDCYQMGVNITPFYEYRAYGYRVNFPQDFLNTQFRLYGATGRFFLTF